MNEQLWIRIGDAGDYEPFGDDLMALCGYLNNCGAGLVTDWVDVGVGIGFATQNYWGNDFISLFWGDADANLVRPLDAGERAAIEASLDDVLL